MDGRLCGVRTDTSTPLEYLQADKMLIMRPYQQDAIDNVYANWAVGKRFVVLVMPTGSGKASVLCEIARIEAARGQRVLITAHRSELISQLSNTLASNELRHNIIAALPTIKYSF